MGRESARSRAVALVVVDDAVPLSKAYRADQEERLGALGLIVNGHNTRYMGRAVNNVRDTGQDG